VVLLLSAGCLQTAPIKPKPTSLEEQLHWHILSTLDLGDRFGGIPIQRVTQSVSPAEKWETDDLNAEEVKQVHAKLRLSGEPIPLYLQELVSKGRRSGRNEAPYFAFTNMWVSPQPGPFKAVIGYFSFGDSWTNYTLTMFERLDEQWVETPLDGYIACQ